MDMENGLLPVDWSVASLGTLATVSAGGTPNRANNAYWNGDVPWITTSQVHFNVITSAEQFITHLGLERSAAKLLAPGTLLMALYGQGPTRGRVAILGIEAATNQACAAIVVNSDVSPEYLFHYLIGSYEQIRGLSNKGNQANLNSGLVKGFAIALPPPAEQRAIAAALSDVDALIEALDAAVAKKRAIKLAAMQQLLTGQARLPGFDGEWLCCKLADLGQFSKGRGMKRDDVTDYGVGCIRYGELYTRYDNYVLNPASRIPPEVAQSALPIHYGDLLFAGSGETAEEIGKCAAYLGEEVAYAGGDIVVLTPSEQNPIYLGHLMNHREVAQQKARYGQGDAVVHISARNLALVDVTLPSKHEQDAIACVLLDVDAEIAALEQRREKTRAIKQGMMQALLTGRVRLVTDEGQITTDSGVDDG